jgi:lactate racemase
VCQSSDVTVTAVPTALVGAGGPDQLLTEGQVEALLAEGFARWNLDGRRVLMLVPDLTRAAPIPMLYRLARQLLDGRVEALDWLVALGTHAPLDPGRLTALVGAPPDSWGPGRVMNHAWSDPDALVSLGTIPAAELAEISAGRIRRPLEVKVNRLVTQYDVVVAIGPVLPHEVVGFSGGNKYFFPGISGAEFIDVSHWLGALITSYEIIGTQGTTPVRRLIDRAAALIPTERRAIALVTDPGREGLAGVWLGECEEAWAAAVDLSATTHIRSVDRAYSSVLSVIPKRYDDMWTGAKGMYKVEPVVADDGEVVIYGPHITEFSLTHGDLIEQVGYHCRDYFLGQWERFGSFPSGILAHSTHLRGIGTWDPDHGERDRIQVTLATGISAERCAAVGLGWRDPATIDVGQWMLRDDALVVPDAGETLYRLRA